MSGSLNFFLILPRRTVPESFNKRTRRSLRAGGALSIKKVKRKMSNSLNFYLPDSPPAAPTRSPGSGGPSPMKKVKRKMSIALNFYLLSNHFSSYHRAPEAVSSPPEASYQRPPEASSPAAAPAGSPERSVAARRALHLCG